MRRTGPSFEVESERIQRTIAAAAESAFPMQWDHRAAKGYNAAGPPPRQFLGVRRGVGPQPSPLPEQATS